MVAAYGPHPAVRTTEPNNRRRTTEPNTLRPARPRGRRPRHQPRHHPPVPPRPVHSAPAGRRLPPQSWRRTRGSAQARSLCLSCRCRTLECSRKCTCRPRLASPTSGPATRRWPCLRKPPVSAGLPRLLSWTPLGCRARMAAARPPSTAGGWGRCSPLAAPTSTLARSSSTPAAAKRGRPLRSSTRCSSRCSSSSR